MMPSKPPLTSIFTLLAVVHVQGAQLKSVSADQEQDGNPAIHAFDQDAKTRWASQGKGTWITAEMDERVEVDSVRIGFARGERDYAFDVRTSMDGKVWSEGIVFNSGGKGEKVLEYKFPKAKLRFLRITVNGSNANDWANIHTIRIPGVDLPEVEVAPGQFVVGKWAGQPELKGAVAISLDHHGRAYMARATRRKQSSLDIRHHQGWVKDDLSFTTIEDRRAYYKSRFNNQDGLNWLPDRNQDGKRDWRDLTVQEDHLHQLWDKDGDGSAESLTTIDRFNTEVTGIAAGVLAVGDDVFVAVEPDIWRYQDVGKLGVQAKKSLVSTGYSLHIGQGGHNMSGMALGPDGRVYWSVADKGHHVVTTEGKTYHMPNSGGIFRCEMDGSQVERYSSGERNAQELTFDAHGNLFSMDNDGDYPGEKERALYITEGSMHGWRLNWQWLRKQDFVKISGIPAYNPWMEEKLFLPDHETQAAYLTPTIGNFGPGPCGFTVNPGTGLTPSLQGRFFMTNNKNQIRVFRFLEKGAFFRFEEEKPIPGGVSNTGLAFGPDGALYAANYSGGVYRFDVRTEDQDLRRKETARILASQASAQDLPTLRKWLGHADQRVRMKGQFELVGRQEPGLDALAGALRDAGKLGKLHAIWGIGMYARLNNSEAIARLQPAFRDTEPEVRAQAAKVVGELGKQGQHFTKELVGCLQHEHPRVRFFAAIALGNQGASQAVPGLVRMLEENGRADAYLRHAAIMGLAGAMPDKELASLANHKSHAVRLAAVVALRRQDSPAVRAFLDDSDELLLLEAARAIHDDQSIPEALPDLASLLGDNRPDYKNEALMRRAINAALRVESQSALQLLVDYLKSGKGSDKFRRTALASILWWANPPVLDSVEGRYRKHAPRDPAVVDKAVGALEHTIAQEHGLVEVLLNGISVQGREAWLPNLSGQFAGLPEGVQTRYLDALAKVDSPLLKETVEAGIRSTHARVRETARGHAKKAGIPVLDLLMAILDSPDSAGKGKAVQQLAALGDPQAKAQFSAIVARYRDQKLDPTIRLEVWQAAKGQGIDLPATDDRFLAGGDKKRGEAALIRNQCIQCHRVGKHKPAKTPAGSIGPDLSKIGSQRDRAHILASLLDPNASIAEGFGTATLKLVGGEEVTGVLVKQTPEEWHLQLPDGKPRKIHALDISSHTLVSVMPNYSQVLQPTDIRDIVAYLAGLK